MDDDHRSDPLYDTAKEVLATHSSLPERFCMLNEALHQISADQLPFDQVQPLFHDVSQQIQKYNEQYQVLLNELGVLCHVNGENRKTIPLFFNSIVDFSGLALSLYKEIPEKRHPFEHVLQQFLEQLQSQGPWILPTDPREQALFVQLLKSSWAFVHPAQDLSSYANQVKLQMGGRTSVLGGGRKKSKTRKNKRI